MHKLQSELDLVNFEKQELEDRIANQSKEIDEMKQSDADRQTNHIEIMAKANLTIDGLEKINEKFKKEVDLLRALRSRYVIVKCNFKNKYQHNLL